MSPLEPQTTTHHTRTNGGASLGAFWQSSNHCWIRRWQGDREGGAKADEVQVSPPAPVSGEPARFLWERDTGEAGVPPRPCCCFTSGGGAPFEAQKSPGLCLVTPRGRGVVPCAMGQLPIAGTPLRGRFWVWARPNQPILPSSGQFWTLAAMAPLTPKTRPLGGRKSPEAPPPQNTTPQK